jgi:transposase
MRHRHAISDEDWTRIEGLLPGQPGRHGKVAKDNRLFVDAVLWIARTGAPWRDLPVWFGNWNSAWRRFDRWARKGVRLRLFEALQDPDLEWLILDSTIIRANPCTARRSRRTPIIRPEAIQGLGRRNSELDSRDETD